LMAALLAGCASAPRVVHLTWVKVPGASVEVQRSGSDCVIVTGAVAVRYDEFGAALRRCIE
jgi:hypothetical protein